jgi:hypothetical protein
MNSGVHQTAVIHCVITESFSAKTNTKQCGKCGKIKHIILKKDYIFKFTQIWWDHLQIWAHVAIKQLTHA